MPMKMHGMRSYKFVVNDEPYRAVSAEVVNIPFRIVRVREIALVPENEERVVEICAETPTVHVEQVVAGSVGAEGDVNCLGHRWVRGRRKGVVRDR